MIGDGFDIMLVSLYGKWILSIFATFLNLIYDVLKNGSDRPIETVHLGTEPLSVWSYIYACAIEHDITSSTCGFTPWFSDRFNKFVDFLACARKLFKKIKMLESWPSHLLPVTTYTSEFLWIFMVANIYGLCYINFICKNRCICGSV
jgi:hypothetical protein